MGKKPETKETNTHNSYDFEVKMMKRMMTVGGDTPMPNPIPLTGYSVAANKSKLHFVCSNTGVGGDCCKI